jgi:pyruvate dehydrogenase E1 component alpha subunit
MPVEQISSRAAGYGMPGRTVDGNDVEAVLEAAREAVAYVRETRRPYLLETYTYRLRGHYEPDDQSYVDPDELKSWWSRDPIAQLRQQLLASQTVTTEQLDELDQRVRARIAAAGQFANESPYPNPEEVLTDVYAEAGI